MNANLLPGQTALLSQVFGTFRRFIFIILIGISLSLSLSLTDSGSLGVNADPTDQPYIWPLPQTYKAGNTRVYIDPQLFTIDTKPTQRRMRNDNHDADQTVKRSYSQLDVLHQRVHSMQTQIFHRYSNSRKPYTATAGSTTHSPILPSIENNGILDSQILSSLSSSSSISSYKSVTTKNELPMLRRLEIDVKSIHTSLNFNVSERYEMNIPDKSQNNRGTQNENDAQADVDVKMEVKVDVSEEDDHNNITGILSSETLYGAIHGLETFSQLIHYDYNLKLYYIDDIPLYIDDYPSFPHRGVLMDTSRHYLPVITIYQVIDSLMINKLNVLHWHIVDTEAFPLQSATHPSLWNGSYTVYERYTIDDINDVVEYANHRGIRLIFELDVPGHAASWCVGEPSICPDVKQKCYQPLDISKEYTFQVISALLHELSSYSNDTFIHLGGDEVDTGCWTSTSHISDWLKGRQWTVDDAYLYSVNRTTDIATNQLDKRPIYWEEVYRTFRNNVSKEAVIFVWLDKATVKKAAQDGYHVLLSDYNWYLDHLEVGWEKFYLNDPLAGMDRSSHEARLVLGGQFSMWGETCDPSVIFNTIYPRASAGSERLWSDAKQIGSIESANAERRLHYFRCYMHTRGIYAAPLNNQKAREAPPRQDSCYKQ